MIINKFADCAENTHECMSSEEMRDAFEEFNDYSDEGSEGFKIISMDVKALYPSMKWDASIAAVKEMIENSEMSIYDNIYVTRYIAVMVPPEEIEAEGLSLVIPKRKKNRTRRIPINYLRQKKNGSKWTVACKPGTRQKKRMLALAISVGVKIVMSNHTYMVGDNVYLQSEGGAIGLELTGAASRLFMQKWDRDYLRKVNYYEDV